MLRRVSRRITVFLCLSAAMVLRQASGESVQCVFVENKGMSLDNIVCECYNVDEAPWPSEMEAPATHPENVSVDFKTSNGSMHAHIKWVHRGRFLRDVKEGFYLELAGNGNLHYYYNCDFDKDEVNVKGEKEVQFLFNQCCGSLEKGSGWKPEMVLTVTVHARPMYAKGSKPYPAIGSGKVPNTAKPSKKSRNRERRKLCKKRKCRKKKKSRTRQQTEVNRELDEVKSPNKKMVLVAVFTSVCSLTCLLLFVLFVFCKFRQKHNRKATNRTLLVIGENADRFIPFVNCLVEIMKNHGLAGTKVSTNVRNSNEIASVGISQWINRNIEAADVIIFIATARQQLLLNSDEQKRSHVKSALNIAESLSLKNGLPVSRKRFLVLDVYNLSNRGSLPFCTCYTLEKDFSKFMKHALHLDHCSNSIHNDCVTLKKLSLYEENSTQKNSTRHASTRETFNNLDNSTQYSGRPNEEQERPLLTLNIADDQLTSVESNE